MLSAAKKKVSFFRMKVRSSIQYFSSHSSFLRLTPLFFFVEMTIKFNQEFYAWIKAKKNEPVSSIGQHKLRLTDKEKEKETTKKGLSTPALDEDQVASSALSVDEISPRHKKRKKKGKEKVGANVWADAEMT